MALVVVHKLIPYSTPWPALLALTFVMSELGQHPKGETTGVQRMAPREREIRANLSIGLWSQDISNKQ